jgi:Spy/CpxP family protein refolding chaperone
MKLFTFFSIAAIILFAGPLPAQHHSGHGGSQMMGDSTKSMGTGTMMKGTIMRGQMMGRQGMPGHGMAGGMPCSLSMLNQQMMWVNRLPDMQNDLSLTDEQVKKLTQLRTEFQKKQIDLKAEAGKKQIDLNTLIDQGVSGAEIRKALQAFTNIEIDSAVSAYETAMKMKGLLTEEQRQKLNDNVHGHGMMMGGQHMMHTK